VPGSRPVSAIVSSAPGSRSLVPVRPVTGEVVLGLPLVAHRERGVARLEADLAGFDEEVTQLDGDRIVPGVHRLGRQGGSAQIGSAEGGFGDESNAEGDDHEESRNRPYKQGF
jgi:hypothetical protein